MPQANVARVKQQLLAEGLELEEFGGTVQVVETAATAGIGLTELEEALLLQVRCGGRGGDVIRDMKSDMIAVSRAEALRLYSGLQILALTFRAYGSVILRFWGPGTYF